MELPFEPSHLDQRWWPEQGIRKRDVLRYYADVAPVLLPHLRNRPFTMKRHYNGPRSPFEWIKDAPPELPDWIPVAPQPAKSRRGELVRYPLVNDHAALLWMVDFGCVDLHVWTSRVDRPDRPDYALFDLDPADVPFAGVIERRCSSARRWTRSTWKRSRTRRAATASTFACRSRGGTLIPRRVRSAGSWPAHSSERRAALSRPSAR